MTKNFDEAAYLQRRAANEAKLTKAGCMARKWNMTLVVLVL